MILRFATVNENGRRGLRTDGHVGGPLVVCVPVVTCRHLHSEFLNS
jgi:hypothetical protein